MGDSVPNLNLNSQQPPRIINMMKVALVLLVATVFISWSAGNPVGGPQAPRKAKQFGGQSFNGGVGTVNNCATTGSCHSGKNGNKNQASPAIQGSQNYNGNVDQVHNCATDGSCHGQGKKKRSIVPEANTDSE